MFRVLCAFAVFAAQEPSLRDELPGEPFERLSEPLRESLAALDPLKDGWESEARASAALEQLQKIARFLETPEDDAETVVGALSGADFVSGDHLRPTTLRGVYTDRAFQVGRDGEYSGRDEVQGAEGLARSLVELRAPLNLARQVHAKFKVVETCEHEGYLLTHAILKASGRRTTSGSIQINAWYRFWWKEDGGGSSPRLVFVNRHAYEEVRGTDGAPTLFSDCTEAVLGSNPAWSEQLLPGLPTWRSRLDTRLGLPLLGHAAGIAIGDVDDDGLEDVYLCQPGGLPNKLFLHRPDGTAVDRSSEAGVDFLDFSRAALLLDFDGDVERDLAVTVADQLLFLSNDGRAHFWLEAALRAPDTTSLSAADIDLDGDLDIYACAYASPYDHSALPVPYHDANNGKPNVLFENKGDWLFADVTRERGLDQNNRRFSFAAAFEDYDRDGDPDLYVANDFGRKNLYRNDGGRFVDAAAQAGVEDISAGMGVTWGDYDQDGWLDLYASNMFSSAGNRVAYQGRFQERAAEDVRSLYRRHARGNTLFRNQGDGTFLDVTDRAGVALGRWAWGALFCDLNNDGWLDLLSPNGFITEERTDDL